MNAVDSLIQQAKAAVVTDEIIKTAIHCLDYTSLGDNDTEDNVRILCQQAMTPLGNVAAICIWPEFVNFAKRELADSTIDIATVVNFPSGEQPLEQIIEDTKKALFDGADEIDVVFPYKAYLSGNKQQAVDVVKQVKAVCGDAVLKVIIESGELVEPDIIAEVSEACLHVGADFLKTSTGKTAVGATLEAAVQMLKVIQYFQSTTKKIVGFKVSGGVRTTQGTAGYIELAESILGKSWLSAKTFRIGASSLLADLLK